MLPRFLSVTALLCFLLGGTAVMADEGHALTVVTTDGDSHVLYLDELDAMDQVEFATTTIWTDGEVVFTGVSVSNLLQALEAAGNVLRMSALNDYAVEMPVSELEDHAPIIATRMNGRTMSIRDKGPYWIVFPFDSDPEYRTETNYSRSVWQLESLVLIE